MNVQPIHRAHRGVRFRPRAEINVTPFVDVMLVLLIVFMITAPLLTAGVELELPRTEATALTADQEPITISVNGEGLIYVGGGEEGEETQLAQLEPRLRAILNNRGEDLDARIYLRADAALQYGDVMAVMARITESGFTNIALVTEPVDEPAEG